MEHLFSLEEISWRQKSRMLCIKEGDLGLTDGEKCYRVDLSSQVKQLHSLEEIS